MGQRDLERGITLKHIAGFVAISTLACALATVGNVAVCHAGDDDWEAVPASSSPATVPAQTPPPRQSAQPKTPPSGDGRTFTVCGERATPPAPRIKAMIDEINGLWGTNFAVYQTVAPEQPHASPGGCVFYNQPALEAILTHRLVANDQAAVDPLVWAIFAHEIGHQVHHDTERSRQGVPSQTKELEADRFSGYTLEKLQIPATDLTPFWNLTGDEFGGPVTGQNQHGLSSQRVAAFKQGWHLAEWNRPEDSESVAEAGEESTAPDNSAAAPE